MLTRFYNWLLPIRIGQIDWGRWVGVFHEGKWITALVDNRAKKLIVPVLDERGFGQMTYWLPTQAKST